MALLHIPTSPTVDDLSSGAWVNNPTTISMMISFSDLRVTRPDDVVSLAKTMANTKLDICLATLGRDPDHIDSITIRRNNLEMVIRPKPVEQDLWWTVTVTATTHEARKWAEQHGVWPSYVRQRRD